MPREQISAIWITTPFGEAVPPRPETTVTTSGRIKLAVAVLETKFAIR